MAVCKVDVRPATPGRWDDVAAVFGRRGDDPTWCWCRRFLDPPREQADLPRGGRDNRAALRDEVAGTTVSPGLIAYIDDHPLGWTRVGPRDGFAGVRGNRALARLLAPNAGAWWITCCFVSAKARKSGVGTALVRAATQFAFEHGATCIEGHPVDVAALKNSRTAPSAIFTGTVAMFTAAGFVEVGRTFPSRPVMRCTL
jgi:GNAT superfamily N-acetyltransferase